MENEPVDSPNCTEATAAVVRNFNVHLSDEQKRQLTNVFVTLEDQYMTALISALNGVMETCGWTGEREEAAYLMRLMKQFTNSLGADGPIHYD